MKVCRIGLAKSIDRSRDHLEELKDSVDQEEDVDIVIISQMKNGSMKMVDTCGDNTIGFIDVAIADLTKQLLNSFRGEVS